MESDLVEAACAARVFAAALDALHASEEPENANDDIAILEEED